MQSEDQVPRDQVEEEARRPVEDEEGDADLSEERVDEEVDAKAAWVLVASARKTLVQGGGMDQLKDNLRGKIKFLDADHAREVRAGGLEEVTLDGWVEELLRFIALKTLMDDTNLPFQLAPSGQIKIAGRLLVELGSSYTNVCQAMGNASAIDPVAFDDDLDESQEKHMQKRFNTTLRNYEKHFDEAPPHLFWKDFKPKVDVVEKVMKGISILLGGATACSGAAWEQFAEKGEDNVELDDASTAAGDYEIEIEAE